MHIKSVEQCRAYSKCINVSYYLLLIKWLVSVKTCSGHIAYIIVLYNFKLFCAQNIFIAENNSINGKLNFKKLV